MNPTHLITTAALCLAGTGASAQAAGADMHILIESQGGPIRVQLADNPSARDFYAQLPLTLKAEDYASSEKIAYLPRKLSTQDAPGSATWNLQAAHPCTPAAPSPS